MAKRTITLALDRYDRHLPFFDGTLDVPSDVALTVFEVGMAKPLRHGTHRHGRMFQGGEFDICEMSLSSFVMAVARDMPFVGLPIFPRRLFSHSQMWVNAATGIRTPADLKGRKVGIRSFQQTLATRAKGDLAFEYGVPWRDIHWFAPEDAETVGFAAPDGLRLTRVADNQALSDMVGSGAIDAYLYSRVPASARDGSGRVRRLFADPRAEERAYFDRHGFIPIMHMLVARRDFADANPWALALMLALYGAARAQARHYYDDPNFADLAWLRHAVEEEEAAFGADAWADGFARNRSNLEHFIRYSLDQGLIEAGFAPERMIHPSLLDT